MPPKKGKGIVMSGNAGNSSKASSNITASTETVQPLFPAGSKYPASLLNERCQKNGWERMNIETPRHHDGYSFVVHLARMNTKTSTRESVRFEPHPPYIRPTAIEARHWGATYALYRFCNNIQLNLVLPPGPREYWAELSAEHKLAPSHQSWMYDADPFAAQKALELRQARAAKRRDENSSASDSSQSQTVPSSREFDHAPEVKMDSSLRDLVEEAVKKAIALYPEADGDSPSVLAETETSHLAQQLGHLGFQPPQIRRAIKFLSQPSPLTSNLLSSLSPLEASIEYLILHLPECDLPQRFLPSHNSSNTFVTSTHAGDDNLKKRWAKDKAVKEAGWPAHVVDECLSDSRLLENWPLLIVALGNRLVGRTIEEVFDANATFPSSAVDAHTILPDEADALGAKFLESSHIVMPLFTAPIDLHVMTTTSPTLIGTNSPSIYLTSSTVPAYIRLHLVAQLLNAVKANTLIESGEGFLVAAMRVLEDEWAMIDIDGPPDITVVLQHLVPKRHPSNGTPLDGQNTAQAKNSRSNQAKGNSHRGDVRSDQEVRHDFNQMRGRKEYLDLLAIRQRLPAYSAREQFLESLDRDRVVVVVGETGCGKTTQLPQFILDSLIMANKGSKTSIIVTQPRRISAISVAARVSAERLDDGSVGYAIRGESKQEKRTKLLFCTTGVVLRRLGSGDNLDGITHVIVDEVHERSVDGDFLLLELKELLKRHSSLKVVLMSATINHETFVKYYGGAPLLEIPGFTHPVKDIYLEDVIPKLNYRPPMVKSMKKESEAEQKLMREEYSSKGLDVQSIHAIQNLTRSDRIDYNLIAAIVEHIIKTAEKRGGILIFLPGVQEIRQCIDSVRSSIQSSDAEIFPLHANLSSEEQRRVFLTISRWKIIAATNVAETSITIDDVIYVVDAGKVKETQYDHENGLSRLVETYVTRAAARQRRGRAGRTQPGTCYKLYTRKQEEKMSKFPIPEILRVPLESISLTIKVMREDENVQLFLQRAIDPPKVSAMEKAWSVLEELGAVDQNGKLTALGKHMSVLPVDLRLAKMLVLGTIFNCLDPILTVASGLSSKPLFVSPMDKREEASQARARFVTGGSDLLTDLAAYDVCMRMRAEGKSAKDIRNFCEENFISAATVREITSLRLDFLATLSDLGFVPFRSPADAPALNANSHNHNLVKAVITGGLWPRVANVHLPKSAIKFDKVQGGAVQRENIAKEFKMYDLQGGRVFLHPASILFASATWKSPFLVYFAKNMTSKVFLRDATEIPLYTLLLFGGPVSTNHIAGGVTVGAGDSKIKLKAWPRIGILVNQLRRLLDAQLQRCIEEGTMLNAGLNNPVVEAMLSLLTNDGLSGLTSG